MITADVIDNLLKYFTQERYKSEVEAAKREFAEHAGNFDQNADDFEMKMAQFADWYLFTRPHSEKNTPPLHFIEETEIELSNFEKEKVDGIKNSRHGIFEYIKTKGDDIYIKDLFLNEKLMIKGSQISLGFTKEELFESRLIPNGESFEFGPAFCFHPAAATKYILKEIKLVRKLKDAEAKKAQKEALIIKLSRMKYKLQQYKHVKITDIYSNNPKLKV